VIVDWSCKEFATIDACSGNFLTTPKAGGGTLGAAASHLFC